MFPTAARARALLGLALPIMGGMVSQNVLNLIDTAFVGRLGEEALAAVGMGGFANWLLISALLGLGSGVQATAARRLGEGRREVAAHGLNAALFVAVVVGVPIAVLGHVFAADIFALLHDDPATLDDGGAYLGARFIAAPFAAANFAFRGFWNGTHRSRNYMFTLIAMHTLNVVLDYGLIFGHLGLPELGVRGAGLATSISIIFGSCLYLGLAIWQARGDGFGELRPSLGVLPAILRLSVPASMQQVFFSAGFMTFFVIAGTIGTDALAASQVLLNLLLLAVLPAMGLGMGGATMVGEALGRGEKADANRWVIDTMVLAVILMTTIGAVLAIGAETWLHLFMPKDPHIVALATVPLMIVGAGQILDGVGMALSQILVGVGDTKAVLIISVASQWLLFLPVCALLVVVLGGQLLTLWSAMIIWRGAMGLALFVRYRTGKWAEVRV